MQSYARERGLTQFISMQNQYSPLYREEEREMMPMLKVNCGRRNVSLKKRRQGPI